MNKAHHHSCMQYNMSCLWQQSRNNKAWALFVSLNWSLWGRLKLHTAQIANTGTISIWNHCILHSLLIMYLPRYDERSMLDLEEHKSVWTKSKPVDLLPWQISNRPWWFRSWLVQGNGIKGKVKSHTIRDVPKMVNASLFVKMNANDSWVSCWLMKSEWRKETRPTKRRHTTQLTVG